MVYILAALLLMILYVLSTVGRRNKKGLAPFLGCAYAHRGLHGNGVPENSLSAVRRARDHGYGAELDIHLLKDGNLAVIHDSQLLRVTGMSGRVEDLTAADLCRYHLEGTQETIPTLSQVLDVFQGEAPLIIELKAADNYKELCEALCRVLDSYSGAYCLESFDPRCIRWLRKNRPELIRGQLTYDFFSDTDAKLNWFAKFVMKNQMANFWTLPDFVAYRFSDRKTLSNAVCREFWGVQGVAWTIRTKEDYDTAVEEGWLPIFENFQP